jgi:uncharacterized transporter YbjL
MKGGDTMQETMEKVQLIIDKYNEQLSANGIKITASKRYFEVAVGERIGNTGNSAIFNEIDRALDRKREKKNGYHHTRNRYHVIVLSVTPAKKDIARREYCKDYAFFIYKVERAHIGMEPNKYTCEEQKILSKIEKRINQILRKSQKITPQKVCKDTLWDAIRYTLSRYGYKRRFLNMERADWELIFLISSGVLALAVALMIWLIGKLI